MNTNPQALWQQCLSLIRDNVTEQQYKTWFSPIAFESYSEPSKTLLLQVPSPFVYEYIGENYVDLLRRGLTGVYGKGTRRTARVVTGKNEKLARD